MTAPTLDEIDRVTDATLLAAQPFWYVFEMVVAVHGQEDGVFLLTSVQAAVLRCAVHACAGGRLVSDAAPVTTRPYTGWARTLTGDRRWVTDATRLGVVSGHEVVVDLWFDMEDARRLRKRG